MKLPMIVLGVSLALAIATIDPFSAAASAEAGAGWAASSDGPLFVRPTTQRIQPLDRSQWTDAHREALGGRSPQASSWTAPCLRNGELCRSCT